MTKPIKPTTTLRQRMIEDMTVHNMSPLTQAAYIRSFRHICGAAHSNRPTS
jgi:hypothetical protein